MRRLYWIVIDGYKEKLNNNDVEFGSAFHEFVKVMKLNPGRYDLAIKAAIDRFSVPMNVKSNKTYLTMNYLQNLCITFWEQYVAKDLFETLKADDGTPLVEMKFSFPFYQDDDVEVLLEGTIDDLCKHKHGTHALRDYKTSSVTDEDAYLSGYALSPQLMFYYLVTSYYSRAYPDSVFARIHEKGLSCFIDGIFLHGKSSPPSFKRSEVFSFPSQQMAEFERLVHRQVKALVAAVKENKLPDREGMLNGACQTVYGKCKFFNACRQVDDISTQHVLNRNYIQTPHEPLKH